MKDLLLRWAVNRLFPWACSVLRWCCPVLRFGRWVLVTRYDDVLEILTRDRDFPVAYEFSIKAIGWEPIQLLARERNDADYAETMVSLRMLWDADDLPRVHVLGEEITRQALHDGNGRVDALTDIVMPSALAVVEKYYGVTMADPKRFSNATYQMAGYIFANPRPGPEAIKAARQQLLVLWETIDKAIDDALAAGHAAPETVLDRWVRGHVDTVPRDVFRSLMTHMIMGFIPAHTNAAGRALEVLLDRPDGRDAAIRMARHGKAGDFNRVVFEALRFLYILPVVWRMAPVMVDLRRDTRSPVAIPAGSIIAVATGSAMMDSRRLAQPDAFLTNRADAVYFTYGLDSGFHYCVGAGISNELVRANLGGIFAAGAGRPAGGVTRWAGMVPSGMEVDYDVTRIPS